jgi:hypothetical protein
MRHDFNTSQIKALVNIIERLQPQIERSISNKQLKLFDDDSRIIRFEVPLKESLLKISSIVEVPVRDNDGKRYRMITGLLTVIVPEDRDVKKVRHSIKECRTSCQANHLSYLKRNFLYYLFHLPLFLS